MPRDFGKDAERLFKSVPKEFDPRTVGTIRIGSLAFYRNHYNEEVADQGEGTGTVSMMPGQSVTLDAKLASALMGVEIMGEHVPRPGMMSMRVEEPGLSLGLDVARREVTLSGAGCTWDFTAADALVFCMTAPSKSYSDTFSGDRVIWSIDRSDVEEFAELVLRCLNQSYPAEASFPFLSAQGARLTATHVEHGPVRYVPREAALENTKEGRLAALLFTGATFIKPSGPPAKFRKRGGISFSISAFAARWAATEAVAGIFGHSIRPSRKIDQVSVIWKH